MKKKFDLIPVEQIVRDAFYSGVRLGISLGELPGRVAPDLIGQSRNETEKVLQKEIDSIFREFKRMEK